MKVGGTAPNFKLKDQNGNEFELYKNLMKKVLLVFYPKDNSLVCSNQLADYNNHLDRFREKGIDVVGISSDSIESHLKFCFDLKLKFPLLADVNKTVIKEYNAINFLGTGKRKLILIDRDKKIIWNRDILPINYLKGGQILSSVNNLDMRNLT